MITLDIYRFTATTCIPISEYMKINYLISVLLIYRLYPQLWFFLLQNVNETSSSYVTLLRL